MRSVGSSSKWARFRTQISEAGHDDAALDRVTTPIGISGIRSKDPAAIAVSVAASVLQQLETASAGATGAADAAG